MGNCMNKKGTGQPLTLAILGLDNAGKTVTTKGLQGESVDTVAPTVGFTNVDFKFNGYDITMFDLGGGKKIRDIWKNYFAEIYGVVYVVDSSEQDRIDESRSVLVNLLEHPQVQRKPMLLLANKQDKKGALDEMDICEYLDLEELVNKYKTPCRVEPCSAIMGQGKKLDKSIKNGLSWLVAMIAKDWDTLKGRVDEDMKIMKEKEVKEKKERAERVRKIREERERKEKEERIARGEAERQESDEEMIGDDPFKRVDVKQLQEKERKAKEAKRLKKERESKLTKSKSEEDYSSMHYRHADRVGGDEQYSDNSNNSPPIPAQRSLRSLPPIDSSDHNLYANPLRASHPVGRLGQYDSPRPNRRFIKGSEASPNASDEDNKVTSSLDRPPWAKQSSGLYSNDYTSNRSSGLPSLGKQYQRDDVDMQPRKGTLSPIGPLQPLDDLDKKKKKKKKAKKNQTVPDTNLGEENEHGWPGVATRASRSPRLDTVQEPDNESDPAMTSFSQKYNLLEDLPELPSTRSHNSRRGPNTDYDDDLVT